MIFYKGWYPQCKGHSLIYFLFYFLHVLTVYVRIPVPLLKRDSVTRYSTSGFSHELHLPSLLIHILKPFQIICHDIRILISFSAVAHNEESIFFFFSELGKISSMYGQGLRYCQCCGAGAGIGAARSRNFWPEPELEPVY